VFDTGNNTYSNCNCFNDITDNLLICELCTILVYSHFTSVILTETFTSITTISTSLVLPVYGYMENKEMNE